MALELEVEKVDQYGRISAYVWLPDDSMFNEVLLSEGDAQVVTFPPHVKYVERLQEAPREADRGLWALSKGELCQQTDRGTG